MSWWPQLPQSQGKMELPETIKLATSELPANEQALLIDFRRCSERRQMAAGRFTKKLADLEDPLPANVVILPLYRK